MIVSTLATILSLSQEQLPKSAELRSGEVIRVYERSYGGPALFEQVLALTPTKAFSNYNGLRHWMWLTTVQQDSLKSILAEEPKNLRAKKRDKPMWPSSYDAQDVWMTYRVNHADQLWTNRDYAYPVDDCPLAKFLNDIKMKLAALPIE